MFSLQDNVAFITGSGQGVGAETARVLAAHGAAVVINDLFADRAQAIADEIAAKGGRSHVAAADVSNQSEISAAVEQAASALGPIDILVNNAGVPPTGTLLRPFLQTERSDWDLTIGLNLYGVLNTTHAVLGPMVERGYGRIISIVSEAARVGEATVAAYAAAKGGAASFSRSLAKEVGRHGVTANCVSIGSIYSDKDYPDQERLDRVSKRYLVGRLGQPADVAAAVLLLASPEASWITGQTIPVNGGYATS
jgi:3-oxoacyl-[acyl-carrier protein] reductase